MRIFLKNLLNNLMPKLLDPGSFDRMLSRYYIPLSLFEIMYWLKMDNNIKLGMGKEVDCAKRLSQYREGQHIYLIQIIQNHSFFFKSNNNKNVLLNVFCAQMLPRLIYGLCLVFPSSVREGSTLFWDHRCHRI